MCCHSVVPHSHPVPSAATVLFTRAHRGAALCAGGGVAGGLPPPQRPAPARAQRRVPRLGQPHGCVLGGCAGREGTPCAALAACAGGVLLLLRAYLPACTHCHPRVLLATTATGAEDVELQRPLVTLQDGRQVPAGDMQRVVTGAPPRPQLVPQVRGARPDCRAGCILPLCLRAAVLQQCPQQCRTLQPRPPDLSPHSPIPPTHPGQFGYISLFPLLMRLVPPSSPVLGRQLELLRDPQRLWTDHGLRSLRWGGRTADAGGWLGRVASQRSIPLPFLCPACPAPPRPPPPAAAPPACTGGTTRSTTRRTGGAPSGSMSTTWRCRWGSWLLVQCAGRARGCLLPRVVLASCLVPTTLSAAQRSPSACHPGHCH